MTIQIQTKRSPLLSRSLIFVLLLGVILRCCSLYWNDRILGDVNLLVLTAQEYVRSDELRYPMKVDYSPNTEWKRLHSPQSQHPPLWSLLAGISGKIIGSKNTYAIVKWLSFFLGVGIILVFCHWINREASKVAPIAISCVALSPMLVDFSGNGSQYSLGSLFFLMACVFLPKDRITMKSCLLTGTACGLAMLTHGAFLFIVIGACAYLATTTNCMTRKLAGIGLCLVAFLVTVTPLLVFKFIHFGSPFHNLNYVHVGALLGQLSLEMDETRIYWDFNFALTWDAIKNYLNRFGSAGISFFLHLLFEWSPFGLALGITGLRSLRRQNPRFAKVILFLGISYLVPVLGWASFKYRFLVPILPLAFVLTATGFHFCRERGGTWSTWGKIGIGGTFVWFFGAWIASSWLTGSPSRYYAFDLAHKVDYSHMSIFSEKIKKLERGTIIGSAKCLDGGIEGVYLHQFPYISARGFSWEYIQKIRKDFKATYFWTDKEMMRTYEGKLKDLEPVLSYEQFRLFRFPSST
jgi:hypothetical protein